MTLRRIKRLTFASALVLAACGDDGGSGTTGLSDTDVGSTQDVVADEDTTSETCVDDELGETSEDDPFELSAGDGLEQLTLCEEGDRDWFAFDARVGDQLRWRIDTDQPLRIALAFGSADSELRYADSSETEDATITITEPGLSLVSVQALEEVPARYSIELDVVPAPQCQNESTEPNDSLVEGIPLQPGDQRPGSICSGDEDWYAIPLLANEALSVILEAEFAQGDLDFSIVNSSGDVISNASTTADVEQVQIEPQGETTVYVRVFAFDESTENTYTIRAATFTNAQLVSAELSGSVAYEDRPYGPEGFTGELVETPSNGVIVQVVNENSEAVVGETTSDADGNFTIDVTSDVLATHRIRVLSAGEVAGQRVEVRDRTRSQALYGLVSEPFSLEDREINLVARADTPLGGAFNIVDVALEAFEFAAGYTDETSPTLTYSWQSGLAWPCGSCYSRNTVSLGGQLEDTDEYDDDIIIHEWTHYWVQYYSHDDSPGGSHRDRQVEPTLAYGEGIAYFFPCMLRDNPEIVDTFIDDVRYIDVEAMTIGNESIDAFFGTTNGEVSGGIREEIITGLMWDAYDGGDDEAHDNVTIGADGSMNIFMNLLLDDDRSDIGARGMDLSDWLDALTCELGGTAEDVQSLTDEREFPLDVEAEGVCAEKYRSSRPALLAVRDGLVLDSAEGIQNATVRWREANGEWQSMPIECQGSRCPIPVEATTDRIIVLEAGAQSASWLGAEAARRMLGGNGTFTSTHGPVREYRP